MILIRPAEPRDCAALARVQVTSYRSAYRGVLPDDFMDRLDVEEQTQDWLNRLRERPAEVAQVAERIPGAGVIGYVLTRALPNEQGRAFDGEITALHVVPDQRRRGVGSRLLLAGAEQLARQGCRSVTLQAVEEHDARALYERLGALHVGNVQANAHGVSVTKRVYAWPDVRALLSANAADD